MTNVDLEIDAFIERRALRPDAEQQRVEDLFEETTRRHNEKRLAVNRDQIDEWGLPTRPTKTTDSRAQKFMREHGTGSVELDAIPLAALRSLVRESIEEHMDPEKLRTMKLAEEQERDLLREVWTR